MAHLPPLRWSLGPGCLSLVLACGCGSSVRVSDSEGREGSSPNALYLASSGACPEESDPSNAAEQLAPVEAGHEIAVVELFFQNECSDLGGHYILARDVDGSSELWLGGHGCAFLPEPLAEADGLVNSEAMAGSPCWFRLRRVRIS